ncbi:MAG: iron ABC transporter permease [Gaiellaceae bacterium MAG52_C11]|nr:iron ABC transporter permease [Candidatus Gaiellasilicea maunaloa]
MRRKRGRRPPLLLWALASAAVGAALLPLGYLVLRGLGADDEARAAVGVRPTAELVLDTVFLVTGVVALTLVLGTVLAWLVVRSDLPMRRLLGVALTLPLVIPSYVGALVLLGALGPKGLLQQALEPLGVDRLPDLYGYEGALLALTLSTYPYVFLIAASALRSVDVSTEEAARSLGRGPLRVFLTVTLPAVRPALGAAGLLVALYVLADFGAVSLMQYPTLTRAVYLQYESLLDRNAAAILALILVALAAVVVWLEGRIRNRGVRYRSSPGAGRRASRIPLGRWRWAAFTGCATVALLFLALPLGVLGWWAAEGTATGPPFRLAWSAAIDSTVASAAAAGCAVVAVVPIALLAWRHPSRPSRLLERIAYVPNAVPGIAVALSLVFFGARYGGFLYQSLSLLVFAYVVRFLPQALATTRSALDLVDPRLEDASRSLGRSSRRTLLRVVLPLARPGVLAGAALVFLSTMKELPATLLLRPIGFDTLATEIWTDTSIGAYADAAPSALLLILVSAPFVYALSARRAWELGIPD